jgi:hypothetical protein
MHCRFVRNSGLLYARIISVEKHGDSRRGREHRFRQRGASTSEFGSGKGIDPEVIPRLFDTFFTTKLKGMGLRLADRALDRREPWVTRNPDGGATLEFDLPVKLHAERESRNGFECQDAFVRTIEVARAGTQHSDLLWGNHQTA